MGSLPLRVHADKAVANRWVLGRMRGGKVRPLPSQKPPHVKPVGPATCGVADRRVYLTPWESPHCPSGWTDDRPVAWNESRTTLTPPPGGGELSPPGKLSGGPVRPKLLPPKVSGVQSDRSCQVTPCRGGGMFTPKLPRFSRSNVGRGPEVVFPAGCY